MMRHLDSHLRVHVRSNDPWLSRRFRSSTLLLAAALLCPQHQVLGQVNGDSVTVTRIEPTIGSTPISHSTNDSIAPTVRAPHAHYHSHPHPTTQDPQRFSTNRDSRIELPLPEEKDAFVFSVFGDRTGGPPEGVEILRQAIKDVNLFEPDLVMTVGDLIQGYNDTRAWMPEMKEYKSAMRQLLCPWFPVAGNHDVYYRGPNPPAGEHEENYEMHFGPLWYAFEHKNSWFIALYSDEGDPKSGAKSFNDPASQTMSPAQFDWLKESLAKAKDAQHVFVFLHHPRWLGKNYGDDWERVHKLLVAAGNVRIVFAGHIHRMRYDGPRDGIEYVTLATVGGGQDGVSAKAGYLHHYHLVTVRKQQIAMACLPIGEVMNVRDITGELSEDLERLARTPPTFGKTPRLAATGQADRPVTVELFNPTSRSVEFTVGIDSNDARWATSPDHIHRKVHPGQRSREVFRIRRMESIWDESYQPLQLVVNADYLADHGRVPLTERMISIPIRIELPEPSNGSAPDMAAAIRPDNCFAVNSDAMQLPDGPLTVECWFKANTFSNRVGLLAKTESSEYGIFVNDGIPSFTVFLGDRYVGDQSKETPLEVGSWHHIAGVYDGEAVRTYVDGRLVAMEKGRGKRRTNGLPLMIGADVDGQGKPTSFFDGEIDKVRVSKIARYVQPTFDPPRRFSADADTVLLLNFDALYGPLARDESNQAAHALKVGDPGLVPLSLAP